MHGVADRCRARRHMSRLPTDGAPCRSVGPAPLPGERVATGAELTGQIQACRRTHHRVVATVDLRASLVAAGWSSDMDGSAQTTAHGCAWASSADTPGYRDIEFP